VGEDAEENDEVGSKKNWGSRRRRWRRRRSKKSRNSRIVSE
jgi:hypothetical protein